MSYEITPDKYLQTNELEQLHRIIKRTSERDAVLLLVSLATGARRQELLNVTTADLIDAEAAIFIRGLKGSYSRTIPLQPELYQRLKALSSGKAKPFDISVRRFNQIWESHRPVKKNLHSLRHTFAIELYKRCKDIRLVQVALGHKSIANTEIYTRLVITSENLRKALL